jgi:hypothetical protein
VRELPDKEVEKQAWTVVNELHRAIFCCPTIRMGTRIASPATVPETSSVASPPVFPLPH